MNDIKDLINIIHSQAEAFLLDSKEFYPFGTYINVNDEIKPFSVFPDQEKPSSLDMMTMLKKYVQTLIENSKCKVAAIAVDVTVKEKEESFDAIELTIFEEHRTPYKKRYKYTIEDKSVKFTSIH